MKKATAYITIINIWSIFMNMITHFIESYTVNEKLLQLLSLFSSLWTFIEDTTTILLGVEAILFILSVILGSGRNSSVKFTDANEDLDMNDTDENNKR